MSSILDALGRLEQAPPHGPPLGPVRVPRPRPWRRLLAFAAAAVLAGGSALVVVLVARPPGASVPAPTEIPQPPAAAVTPPADQAAAPATPDAGSALERAAPVAPPTPENRPLAVPIEAPSDPIPNPEPPVPLERRLPPPTIASRPLPDDVLPPPALPAGAPDVHLAFLLYSARPERRSVAVQIDGGPLTTLREGDETGGLTVLRIQPDHVELDWQGQRFVVATRR